MTVQSEIYLASTPTGARILAVREKRTLFSKNTISDAAADLIRQAIRNHDGDLMASIAFNLNSSAMEQGWGSAPGGYCLKHLGFMVGLGLYTPDGVKSDMTFTVRTEVPIV